MVEHSYHLVPLRDPDAAPALCRYASDPGDTAPRDEPRVVSTSWPAETRLRRRWQRDFLDWYRANESRFEVKLDLLRCADTCLCVGFHGISRVITTDIMCGIKHYDNGKGISHRVGFCEITVNVCWAGVHWDIIEEFNTYPEKIAGGYVCRECREFRPADSHPVFDSPLDLRRVEVFEPFLAWVNGDLANAAAVAVSGKPKEMTWAYLYPSARFDRARRSKSERNAKA